MLATAGISMMLSNTATTAMMTQIVKVVLDKLDLGVGRQNETISRSNYDSHESLVEEQSGTTNMGTWNESQNEDATVYQTVAIDRETCRTDPTNDREVVKEFVR